MDIKTVGVIGAGTMGNGIAHVFAKSGYKLFCVTWRSASCSARSTRSARIWSARRVKVRSARKRKTPRLAGFVTTTNREALKSADFVVEAATEKFEIKSQLFRDLDRICRPEVILATNTSSISITKLAALPKRPEKVIGMHFFNPVPVMKLVEVIRGLATSQETSRRCAIWR